MENLKVHLSMLRNQGLIENWHDRDIIAGEYWEDKIDDNLDAANIIMLLVSANFLSSRYCYDIEMMRAMERHESGDAVVLPIILSPVEGWQYSPFAKLQVLPKDGKPVTKWDNIDEAFQDIARGVRKLVEQVVPNNKSTNFPRISVNETTSTKLDSKKLKDKVLIRSLISQSVVYIFEKVFDDVQQDGITALRQNIKSIVGVPFLNRIAQKKPNALYVEYIDELFLTGHLAYFLNHIAKTVDYEALPAHEKANIGEAMIRIFELMRDLDSSFL